MVAEKVQELEQENIALKEQVKKLQDICGNKVGLSKNCEYCENFIQHYLKNGEKYYPVYTGCCKAGNRVKSRKVTDTCKSFVKKQYGKNFV